MNSYKKYFPIKFPFFEIESFGSVESCYKIKEFF